MKSYLSLVKRNIKIFFKDKGMFFTSLITPIILLILYATFLAKVYRDSFASSLAENFTVPDKLIDGTVGAELLSSLLAVSSVTVAFCSNPLTVQDKLSGARKDMLMTPVKKSTLALAYFSASFLTTLIVSLAATAAGFIYLAFTGWYMSFADVLLLILDVIILTAFGTALSSIVNVFITTQGQGQAVGTVVSAGYGFICGAYMPIANFGKGLRNTLMFLPGTYGTSLIRNHALSGVYKEMAAQNFPSEVIESIKDSIDCNIYFFDHKVELWVMYAVMLCSIALLAAALVIINKLNKKRV